MEDAIDNQIEQLLKNVAEDEGLTNFKIEKAAGSAKGDGYFGVITAIAVTGKINSGNEKVLRLIVKSAIKDDAVRTGAPLNEIYEREIFMYNNVIPAFQKLEREKGLPPLSCLAKCYKACMFEKSETLILEDLKEKGYRVWEDKLPLEHEHVGLVMKEFGRIHALSMALKDQKPEKFKGLTDNMSDMFMLYMERTGFVKTYEKKCRKVLEAFDPIVDKKARDTFEKFIGEIDGFIKNLPNSVDKYSVILHGDGWTNNLMFKYGEANNPERPTEMTFLDLQMSRFGSPVLDLSYFFYACCSNAVIDNYKKYMRIYYESVSDYLRKLGSNPDIAYPYAVFEEQWRQLAVFGLINASVLIHVILSEKEERTNLTEATESGKSVSEVFDYSIANASLFNDRIKHIILHCISNGFL